MYFEDSIEILVTDTDAFSVEAVERVLTAKEIEFTKVEAAR